jgi:hypothetical protein
VLERVQPVLRGLKRTNLNIPVEPALRIAKMMKVEQGSYFWEAWDSFAAPADQ